MHLMATKLDHSSPADSQQAKPTTSPSLASKLSIFGTKAGFVIPKNKLAGSLVIRGGNAKSETSSASREGNKHVQRKTKWGPDLASDPAVCKFRAAAYQTRVEQIAKQLKPEALEMGKLEGLLSATEGLNSDSADNEEAKFELLELERREIIGEILRLNPGFKVPEDYRPLLKETKIPLTAKAHPGHNIIGILIGPESNTQKRLQEETGAIIRVYGTKKINGEKSEIRQPDVDVPQAAYEDLYISVSADSYDKVDTAIALIELLLAPVSVNSTATSTSPCSSQVTSDAVNPIDGQPLQGSQPGLLQHHSHNAPWLSTPQIGPSNPPPMAVTSSLPNNPSQPGASLGPYTSQPPHFNTMPGNPLTSSGPLPSIANIQLPPPRFLANTSMGTHFGQTPGIVSPQPQPVPSTPVPPPIRPLQTPHASGGWPSFSPGPPQSQRPPHALPTYMPVRPPISVSPIGAYRPQDPIASVPLSNIPTNYHSQHPPVTNFTPSGTLLSRPPGGTHSFPSVPPQGSSSMQILPFPVGASPQAPYPLSMQVRPRMSTPDTVRETPPFSQVGPTPAASASTICSQASIGALRPQHPAAGDFTFQPSLSTSQMGMHASIRPVLPHAPIFSPANQSPNAPVPGFQRPFDGRSMDQPQMHAPPLHFPAAFPRNPTAFQLHGPTRGISPAVQPDGQTVSQEPPASGVPGFLPSRPFQFMAPPQRNPFSNTNSLGDNPAGANPIYDPFAPTASSGTKKTDADPE